jgi:LysM repeat protein
MSPSPGIALTMKSSPGDDSDMIAMPDFPPFAVQAPFPQAADRASETAVHFTVRAGDTLWDIAMHYGITVAVIVDANRLGAYPLIVPGMDLLVPFSNEVGTARPGPDGPIVTGRGLHFVASMSAQACWLFDDGAVLRRWPCSTGRPSSPSVPGNYTIQTKMPRGYFVPADSWMPDWLGIYEAGGTENGIHGIPYAADTGEKFWQNDVGTPVTFGCVMLDEAAADQLWALAYIGMPVTILP